MHIRRVWGLFINGILPPALKWFIHRLIFLLLFLPARCMTISASRLHLGCGKNVMSGWHNIDLETRLGVIKWDCTLPMPVKSGSIDFIFNEHFIEHITLEQGRAFVAECHRVLRIGGILRISTPDLKTVIEEYHKGYASDWKNLDYSANTGEHYTPCRMVNDSMRLWEHQFLYDTEEIQRLLKEAGFSEVKIVPWRSSEHDALKGLESRDFHYEIILEAKK